MQIFCQSRVSQACAVVSRTQGKSLYTTHIRTDCFYWKDNNYKDFDLS